MVKALSSRLVCLCRPGKRVTLFANLVAASMRCLNTCICCMVWVVTKDTRRRVCESEYFGLVAWEDVSALPFDLLVQDRPLGRVNVHMQVSIWTEDVIQLANALTECGLMALIREEECGVVEHAGAFSVPKKGPEDLARVILDCRPRNAVERGFADVLQEEGEPRLESMALRLFLLPQVSSRT
eukprot:2547828-Amphidinium_carterae.1